MGGSDNVSNPAYVIYEWSLRDRVDLRSSDHFRNYFTSVEVHLDKTGEEFEKRYNEPTIKYSHHPKEKEKGVDEEVKVNKIQMLLA